jgi:hypothetical protein
MAVQGLMPLYDALLSGPVDRSGDHCVPGMHPGRPFVLDLVDQDD